MSSATARIAFDVALTLAWRGHITTGIPRVEAEIAAALLERNDPNILFCQYRAKVGAFQRVSPEILREALIYPRIRSVAHQPPRRRHRRRLLWKSIERGWRRYLFPPSDLLDLGPTDAYISVGAWWNLQEPEISIFGRLTSLTRTILMCHDVIPLLFPEYFEEPEVAPRFRRALRVFSDASGVVCNSNGTRQDLSNALVEAGLAVPHTHVLQLPPGLSPNRQTAINTRGEELGRFVLVVGSISYRKNQAMLLDIWSRFSDEALLGDVKLIMAGAWGENSSPVRDKLEQDPKLFDRVRVMNNVTDEELAWLYRNCLFTVYPSLYEGWGLPIGESLGFGKVCVTSDAPAMEEAGRGLCVHLPPTSVDLWHATIRRLLTEPALRTEFETKIGRDYKAEHWKSASDALFNIASSSQPRAAA
jgi:glycosyltransferase involved in cell wall biosynthesis